MSKLPVLLSIPHGGMEMPLELKDHCCITRKDLFEDIDAFVQEIYNINESVECVITSNIARTFVDLNRSLQDLPPKNPDGLIKSCTCYEKSIYYKGKEPDQLTVQQLIQKYYLPYHRQIQKNIRDLDLQLCLDCHSMAGFAPDISPDGNKKKRPMFCLSNQDGKTSSQYMIELLASCISESFDITRKEISINDPFHGGYITKTYGNNPFPWIQIEMNRDMYLSEVWFDMDSLSVEPERIAKLNKQFKNCLNLFFSKI